jgi:uracil-DNA glycosylase family 4
MNKPLKLPVFDSRYANCESCELLPQLERRHFCCAYRPEKFNGVMIVGEGPGQQEVSKGRPFVGISGQLLRLLFDDVGINIDECYITNATLCKPPPKDKALHEEFPRAIPSCIGRLEKEIEAVRPKIIVTLGAAAWIAISGYDVQKTKTVPFDCDNCDPLTRKVGPVLQCASAVVNPEDESTSIPCGYTHFFRANNVAGIDAEELLQLKALPCPKCGATFKRLRPKMIKCPKCGGRKRRNEEYTVFDWEYNVTAAAGAIFVPGKEDEPRQEYELDPWLAAQGVQYVLPTYHPAFLLRGQQFYAKTVQKHLKKIPRLLGGGKVEKVQYTGTSDPAVVRNFVYAWLKENVEPPHFSNDIETEAFDADGKPTDAREIRNVTKIKCIGISTLTHTLVVDTRNCNPSNPDDKLLEVLYQYLTDDRIPKSFHHGFGYDLPVLELVWGIPCSETANSCVDDTMCAHINLYPDEPHRLEHVTFEVADVHAWKPPRTQNGAQVHASYEELELYNARDTWHTRLAIEHFGVNRGQAIPGGRMDRAGLSKVYEVDSQLRKIALGMTMAGVPLNYRKFREVGEHSRKLIAAAEASIRSALKEADHPAPNDLNFNSAPQLISLLFGRDSFFQLAAVDTTAKGQPETSRVALQKLLSTTENTQALKVLNGLIELRKQKYVASNFVFAPAMQPWKDGRVHFIWQSWGARTGRFTSSPNGQNVPIWLRDAFEAPEGRCIVGADADQLELRMIAWLSGDEELIKRVLGANEKRKLEPEYDPHSFVGSIAFPNYTALSLSDPNHVKPTQDGGIKRCMCETCRRKTLRDIIKRVIYGLNYGAGEYTVLEAIYNGGYEGPPITIPMISHVKKTVFTLFKGIPLWRDEQVKLARENGALFSPIMKRRRIFPLAGFPGVEIPITEIFNYPIQSGGADYMNEAFILFCNELPSVDPTAFPIAQIHDAGYAEASEDRGEDVKKLLVECMTVVKERHGITMRFSASGKVGKTMVA